MRKVVAGAFAVAVLAGLGLLGWQVYVKATAGEGASRGRPGTASVAVEVAQVQRGAIRDVERFSGSLWPRSQYEVAPKIGGRLDKLLVDVGDTVRRGQLIAQLDAEEYGRQVEQARAALEVAEASAERIRLDAALEDEELAQKVIQAEAELKIAEASVAQCRSTLNVASREHERAKALRDKGVLSPSDFDEAEARFLAEKAKLDLALAQVAEKEAALTASKVRLSQTQRNARAAEIKHALAEVAQKGAALKAADVRLSYTQIHAGWDDGPDTRVVGERFVDAGAMLKANDPIVSVLDIHVLKGVIHVTERDYAKVHPGQEVTATTDGVADRAFTGRIVRVAPLLREASRQARVEIEVPNPNGLLKPGMFIRAAIDFGAHEGATIVPRSSLVRRNGKRGLFLVDREKLTAHFVPVSPGIVEGDLAEILDPPGTVQDAWVVTLGHHLLEDGSKITLPAEQPTPAPGSPSPPPEAARP